MPDLYEFIDFSIKPKSLDNEFGILFPESKSENRRVDKLFEVHLKDGKSKWVLLNIEIQSYEDDSFDKRMFQHYFRIFDKFDKEIEAIVIYTYEVNRHKYKQYESKFLQTRLLYEYRVYDLAEQSLEKLKESKNPFSFVVQTLIKGFNHKDTDKNNFDFKKELTSLLFVSGYSKYEIKNVFRFINFVLEIKNKELRSKFYGEVIKMPLVKDYDLELTDFEEVALEVRDYKIKSEIALNLYKLGMDLEKISDATKLSIEDVENIIKNIP
ncbi:MAG: hypothetical protein AABZ74_15335 [Cyanobacteriota bacterium]